MTLQVQMESASSAPAAVVRRPTVFVATSDPEVRSLLASILGAEGATVIAFADGFHLVEQLAEPILNPASSPGSRPDLIIADAILPGCTGLSLVAGIRDLRWGTPVVLITGDHRDLKRARAFDGGVTSFFLRPFEVEELAAYATLLMFGEPRRSMPDQQLTAPAGPASPRRLARGTRDMPAPKWIDIE